jgi:hypothetical protein
MDAATADRQQGTATTYTHTAGLCLGSSCPEDQARISCRNLLPAFSEPIFLEFFSLSASRSKPMAEAIAALSLASSILQVIDFGSKFASTAWNLYKAAHHSIEGLDEIASLRAIHINLSDVLQDIRMQSSNADPASESSEGIVNLANECATLVEELLQSLSKLSLRDASRKRDALRAAFKFVWKGEEINALQARLNDLRSQLTLSLLVSVRSVFRSALSNHFYHAMLISVIRFYASQSLIEQKAILRGLHEVQEKTQSMGCAVNSSIDHSDRFGTSVLNYVTSKLNHKAQVQERRLLQIDVIHAIRKASAGKLEICSTPVHISVSEEARKRSLSVLLSSLRYSGMNDREGRITKAHQSTLRWLFKDHNNDKWTSFKDWLQSDDKLYWITGKAGSGKSTLMKYICYPVESTEGLNPASRCCEYLKTWSCDKHLIIASFYFWNSGILMQMTQIGLLMSLLHQILEQCPQLAPLACPDRWEALCLFGDDPQEWEEQELRNTLRRTTKNVSQLGAAVALFVDGLDEFHGKPEELISLFQDALNFPHVKICVASRPWVEFQDAFKHKPSLMLEYLTYDDIKSFVTSRFHNEPIFAQLYLREKEFASQLIEDLVSKASGVFLWVTLVVSSLLAGISFGDRVSDLKRRLDLLPPDLSKLYEKMLLSLDQFYLEHAAQLFSLVGASSAPLNLILASFVDEDDPTFALGREIRSLSRDEIVLRMDTMRRRINSRSKGLLEVKGLVSTPGGIEYDASNYEQYTIQYLHRTVKDYIEHANVQKTLQSAMQSTFDPHLRLLAGHVAYAKGFDPDKMPEVPLWADYFSVCGEYARAVLPSSIPNMVILLDEIDKVASILSQTGAASQGSKQDNGRAKSGLWAFQMHPFKVLDEEKLPSDFNHAFLSLAVTLGIVEYVRVKAGIGCLIQTPTFTSPVDDMPRYIKWPLLMDAVCLDSFRRNNSGLRTSRTIARFPDLDLPMIQCLVDKGADPNYMVGEPHGMEVETSALIESISQLMLSVDRSEKHHSWVEVIRIFARAGKIDNHIVDCAIRVFLHKLDLDWPKFRLKTFREWYITRRSVRMIVQKLALGKNPNFSEMVSKVKSFGYEDDPSRITAYPYLVDELDFKRARARKLNMGWGQ